MFASLFHSSNKMLAKSTLEPHNKAGVKSRYVGSRSVNASQKYKNSEFDCILYNMYLYTDKNKASASLSKSL